MRTPHEAILLNDNWWDKTDQLCLTNYHLAFENIHTISGDGADKFADRAATAPRAGVAIIAAMMANRSVLTVFTSYLMAIRRKQA